MAESAKLASFVLSTFLMCSIVMAIGADAGNPYQGIVDRNVFGLKPPPPPGKPEEKKPDLPPITLTGITTILGNKRALMNVPVPGKPPRSYILAEGTREGDIEVLEIDEKAGTVKVNQSGTIVALSFEKNGPKLPASVPGTMPGATPPGMPGLPQPTPIPYVPGAPPPVSSGLKTIPTRQIRLSQPGAGGRPSGFPQPAQPFTSRPRQ